ncbi:PF07600 family protein [Leptospira interrogans serovar Zanoni str. LT2156]|uniref:PF07600 family protein n=1 Tax=Leptospira interrogans serovar Zanoni str. LT2156 TaxID=1001601 RepID=M6I3M5_LEPIR|nr:PF07600 family protein [Leptospira interrogans serovar Zanoni str. LT2156]
MGILLLNSDHEISSTFQKNRSETVTLLIPEDIWLLFSEKDVRLLTKRIPTLLKVYAKYLSSSKRLGKKADRTLYQPSPGKLKMKRISVRVPSASWTLLGTLAQAHGVSKCYLFNYLLKLEALGVGNSILNTVRAGVPTFHWSYSYILHLDLSNNQVTRKLHCEPESYFYALDLEWYST